MPDSTTDRELSFDSGAEAGRQDGDSNAADQAHLFGLADALDQISASQDVPYREKPEAPIPTERSFRYEQAKIDTKILATDNKMFALENRAYEEPRKIRAEGEAQKKQLEQEIQDLHVKQQNLEMQIASLNTQLDEAKKTEDIQFSGHATQIFGGDKPRRTVLGLIEKESTGTNMTQKERQNLQLFRKATESIYEPGLEIGRRKIGLESQKRRILTEISAKNQAKIDVDTQTQKQLSEAGAAWENESNALITERDELRRQKYELILRQYSLYNSNSSNLSN